MICLWFVKGETNNKASCHWRMPTYINGSSNTSPSSFNPEKQTGDYQIFPIRYKTNADPTTIYPNLKIDNNQEKIIVSVAVHKRSDNTLKQACGFHLLNPKYLQTDGYEDAFSSVIIFTPKPGLFNETAPS